ncbi:MAG: CDP-alcohol phosphatidyltransferase family protein [Defluviitaleaceae bacterium]|nr:CDP-alcohol phosphatidyltransferase family protein [Defluviitaleaceae bacterium]
MTMSRKVVRYIPNTLSIMRIFLCLPLLVLEPFTFGFMLLYTLAGLTDMIDGPIARYTNTTSKLGAALDGSADFLFGLIALFRILPRVDEFSPVFIAWIALLLAIRFISIAVGFIRFREILVLHTYANKFIAFALFLFPLLYLLLNINILLLILCVIAMFAFLEELIINASTKKPNSNIKGLFFRKNA